jgi:hypothetical protein
MVIMKIDSIDFPAPLLRALRDGKLVVFAGTGVSMGAPANLPDFKGLAKEIALGSDKTQKKGEPIDRFLGRLQNEGVDLYKETEKIFGEKAPRPTSLHRDLSRIFGSHDRVRIVTTNYDRLFEDAVRGLRDEKRFTDVPEVFNAPALPAGNEFQGIVHVHGTLGRPVGWVMTQSDFGRAYLTEGWARRFLVDLFRRYVVLFIGYSHNDLIMNYLSSALATETSQMRYALDYGESSKERWGYFGITLISYPKIGRAKHSSLRKGMSAFADFINRGTDGWKQRISSLAQGKPPSDPEDSDEIKWALRDATGQEGVELTGYFTEAARAPEWLDWLDAIPMEESSGQDPKTAAKLLDPLFMDGSLGGRYRVLSTWLAENYAVDQANALLLVAGKHSLNLNPLFWRDLANNIAYHKTIAREALTKWISVLLHNFSENLFQPASHFLLLLGQKCARLNAIGCMLDIFDAMIECRLSVKAPFVLPSHQQPEKALDNVDMELIPIADHWEISELWNGGNSGGAIRNRLEDVADKLLPRMTRILEKRHNLWMAWGKADRNADGDSWGRSAIEPHEQNTHLHDPMDVIIDAARESLEWILKNQPDEAAAWRDRLARAEAPLLRRLALHILDKDSSMPADAKADWLMARFGLCDVPECHEIHCVLWAIYPELTKDKRGEIIAAILTWKFPRQDITELEETTDRCHYDLLHWLDNAIRDRGQDCELILAAMDPLDKKYPQWRPSEHPDLTHYTSGGSWSGFISPYSADKLLSRAPAEWLPDLLAFRGQEWPPEPNREGLIHELGVATRRNLDWGEALASALMEQNLWNSDLWNGLFYGWGWQEDAGLDETQFGRVLEVIGKQALWAHHPHAISHLLYNLVKGHGKPYAVELFQRTHAIAKGLWNALDGLQADPSNDDWMFDAINSPAGVLTEYWMGSLSLWMQRQDPKPRELAGDYREALTAIADDRTVHGRLGRAIFAMDYRWLFYLDEQWTREHLLPFFSLGDIPNDFKSAWQGFLYANHIDPNSWATLAEPMLAAIPQIYDGGLLATMRDRFIDLAACFIAFIVSENPLKRWTPALLKDADDNARAHFARSVQNLLCRLDEVQQREWWTRWLRLYWEKRINGIPAPRIGNEEASAMLTWLSWLPAIFDEAVDVALTMKGVQPSFSQMMSHIVYHSKLCNQEFVQAHAIAFKRLLDYRDQVNPNEYSAYFDDLQKIKSWL